MSQKPYHSFTVVGCGAIGTLLASGLATVDATLTVVDRGTRYNSIRANGLVIEDSDGTRRHARPDNVADHLDLPSQDLVILAVKAHQIRPIAKDLSRLLHRDSVIVTMQNGLPWWYFQGGEVKFKDFVPGSVDPGADLSSTIPCDQVIGCIAYPAAMMKDSGVVRHIEGNRFPVGELNDKLTPRLIALSELFEEAGFKSPTLQDLRGEIWLKLWGALAFNPLSMLTRATMSEIAVNPHTRNVVISMMREAEIIAGRLGVSLRVPLEKRLAGAQAVGLHKTSSLQDLEKGERSELTALLGSVIELGRLTDVPTPTMDSIYACCTLLAETVAARRFESL